MDDFDQSEQSEDANPLPEATVQDYLMQFVAMLASQTWVRLGLMVSPSTGKQETDLEQARLAINVIEYLIDQLEPGSARRCKTRTQYSGIQPQAELCRTQDRGRTRSG